MKQISEGKKIRDNSREAALHIQQLLSAHYYLLSLASSLAALELVT